MMDNVSSMRKEMKETFTSIFSILSIVQGNNGPSTDDQQTHSHKGDDFFYGRSSDFVEAVLFVLIYFMSFNFYDIFRIAFLFLEVGISSEWIEVNESAKATEEVNVVNFDEN